MREHREREREREFPPKSRCSLQRGELATIETKETRVLRITGDGAETTQR